MTTSIMPRRNGFTFSSSGSAEYINKVDVAAFHDGRCSVAELIRRALRLYIESSDGMPQEFKDEFRLIDLEQQSAGALRRHRFSSERKALELAELEAIAQSYGRKN